MRRTLQPTLLFATVAFTALMLRSAVPRIQNGVWEPRGAMPAARSGAAAALLADGRMLVIGGTDADGVLAGVDAYGEFGAFTPMASMNVARKGHTATVLEDGRVLVSGGTGADGAPLGDAEIYDPDSDSWALAASAMIEARSGHVAVRLQDGKVLLVGGDGALGPIDTLEVFEPRTGAFSAISAHLAAPRTDLAAARLNDGTVLVVGGSDGSGVLSSVDLYSPSTGSVVRTGNLAVPRRGHSATTLTDGRVVVIGGSNGSSDLASAEIYDPVTRTFSYLASGLEAARRDHSAFLLPFNGSVLVVGGSSSGQALSSSELFLPWTGLFRTTGSLADARDGSAGGPLAEPGTLLVAGGRSLDSSELYGFACVVTDTDDYGPGETAFINGRGFQPNEDVTLEVDHVTGAFGDASGHQPWIVTTDAQGDFTSSWYVDPADSIGMLFKLTAQNAEGLHAETLFKDGPKVGTVVVGQQTPAAIRPSVSATYVVTVERGTGPGAFTATLSMTSTLPAGVTASFSPNPVSFTPSNTSRTATLTITTTSATPGGVVPFTVKAATSASDFALGDGSLTIDDTGPDTTIASHPAQPSNSASASFTFAGTDDFTSAGSLTFECDLDGAGFSACSSPKSYAGLSNASHTFRVRAKDQAGNLDASPDSFAWTIDTVAPAAPSTPDLHSASDSGSSTSDNITNVSGATFTGTAEDGSTVKLFSDGVEKGSAVATGGAYSITTSPLVQGPHAITASATDAADNTSAGSGSLSVTIDMTPPGIAAHALVSQEAANASGAVVTYTSPATTDAVDGAGVASCSPASGTNFALGETSVSCQATDAAGNVALSTSFIVKVQDTTAPVIAAHADIVEEATSAAGAVVSYTVPTISDAVDGAGSAICSPAPGSTFALGVTSVSCHATDAAGNAAVSTSFNVRVQDTTAPVIETSAMQAVVVAEATSAAGAVVTFANPPTTDAVDGPGIAICAPASGSIFALGETSISCHATDAAGNAAVPTGFIVKVQDTTAPLIATHANMVEEATSAAGAVVSYSNPGTSDAVDGVGAAICSPASGGTFALGLTSVSCHATDAAGNVALSTSFTVKVQDTTAPVIAAHTDMVEEATSAAGAVVTYSNPNTSDAVDGAGAANCSPASGSTFSLGETSVSCHATDAAGNVALSTSFTMKVQDTTAPVIAAHADMVEEATSAAGAVVSYSNPNTSDAVDGAGAANCSPASGSTFSLGETSVSCHATDAAGNVALSTSFTVRVQDTTAPDIVAHADMVEEATSAAGAVVSYSNPSTSDAVDGAGAASCTPASGSTFSLGETSVSCHAIDAAGNAALSTSFTVKVQDTTAPVIAAHADMIEEATSAAGAVVTYLNPSTSDAVDGAGAAICAPASGGTFALGMTSVSCHATDTAGNAALSTSFTVKVQDTTPPVAQAESYAVDEDATLNQNAPGILANDTDFFALTAVQSSGASSGALTLVADGSFSYAPAANFNGTDTFSYRAHDSNSNESAVTTVTITVRPVNDPPTFTMGANPSVVEDSGPQSMAWATALSAGPSDEASQALSFVVGNDNNALFAAQPAIASDGTLSFTPAVNTNGSATVTVELRDDGGAANGGVDRTAPRTFTISVLASNDAPSFTKGGNQTVLEDAGSQSASLWATGISSGPANESSQSVSFIVTNDNNAMFSVQPTVSSAGMLTYTPAANANGTATVTVSLHDSGGTANGGVDTSAAQTFTITVTGVNDAPSFVKGPGQTVARNAGPQTVAGWAGSISAGPANESGQSVTFVVSNDNNALFSVQPKISPNGTLTYTPAPTSMGPAAATVSVQLRDDGGTANGGVETSAIQTFTIYASYAFTGFFEPVDNLPTVNRVNSGSAVPLKFSLAGNQGLDIFAAGFPASVKVNCDTGSAVDDIEITETAGSSSLTYDSGAGQYKYIWKTEKSWSNTCRQLLVRFKDGTADKVAVFKFK